MRTFFNFDISIQIEKAVDRSGNRSCNRRSFVHSWIKVKTFFQTTFSKKTFSKKKTILYYSSLGGLWRRVCHDAASWFFTRYLNRRGKCMFFNYHLGICWLMSCHVRFVFHTDSVAFCEHEIQIFIQSNCRNEENVRTHLILLPFDNVG